MGHIHTVSVPEQSFAIHIDCSRANEAKEAGLPDHIKTPRSPDTLQKKHADMLCIVLGIHLIELAYTPESMIDLPNVK